MFHVLDHAEVVYSGDLSQATHFIIERLGKSLDEAIRSGVRILFSDESGRRSEAQASTSPAYWDRVEDWEID